MYWKTACRPWSRVFQVLRLINSHLIVEMKLSTSALMLLCQVEG